MKSENSHYCCELQESLVKMGAALAGDHASSMAKAVFSQSEIREQVFFAQGVRLDR